MFLLRAKDLNYGDSLSASYGGNTYVKALTFAKTNQIQALAEARKKLDQGVICLVIDGDSDISIWTISDQVAFAVSSELKQAIILLVNDLIGPIGTILVERTLPGVTSLKQLGLRLEQKIPDDAKPKLREYFASLK